MIGCQKQMLLKKTADVWYMHSVASHTKTLTLKCENTGL